jgi:hypothetical protein
MIQQRIILSGAERVEESLEASLSFRGIENLGLAPNAFGAALQPRLRPD